MSRKKKSQVVIPTALEPFCSAPTYYHFTLLPPHVRELVVSMSKEALVEKKKSNHTMMMAGMLAQYDKTFHADWRHPIKDPHSGFIMDILPKGKLFYRASKDKVVLEKNKATYFAPTIHIANLYMRNHKNGFLNVYQTAEECRLFRLDDLDNVNRLLRSSYASDKQLYKIIADMFVASHDAVNRSRLKSYIQSENPVQFKKLLRSSLSQSDFRFANWLCSNGFHGYSAGQITSSVKDYFPRFFHEEIMLCDPTARLRLVVEFSMKKKEQSRQVLQRMVEMAQRRNIMV